MFFVTRKDDCCVMFVCKTEKEAKDKVSNLLHDYEDHDDASGIMVIEGVELDVKVPKREIQISFTKPRVKKSRK